jgi:hypothetical protein
MMSTGKYFQAGICRSGTVNYNRVLILTNLLKITAVCVVHFFISKRVLRISYFIKLFLLILSFFFTPKISFALISEKMALFLYQFHIK